MSRSLTKAERLREMEWLYLQRPFSDSEMASVLGVNRTTVYRDRLLLAPLVPLVAVDAGRWKVDRPAYISNVRLTLHEALALYLAARRVSRQTHTAQPHLAGGLDKLARTLVPPMAARLNHAAASLLNQDMQSSRLKVLETITQAWVEQRCVRISYHSLNRSRPVFHTVEPYLIEPSLWDSGTYLIGFSDSHQALTTFKVERIESANLLRESFNMPEDFDDRQLLRFAWGIWIDEDAPDTVRLRFAPGQAARRLRESSWHPTQVVCEAEDGGCTWEAQVADWHEMLPWVRSWGPDCEALEPEELREMLREEAGRWGRVYG
jgi:predicted DNA-binding transcriptional regulator YafY